MTCALALACWRWWKWNCSEDGDGSGGVDVGDHAVGSRDDGVDGEARM